MPQFADDGAVGGESSAMIQGLGGGGAPTEQSREERGRFGVRIRETRSRPEGSLRGTGPMKLVRGLFLLFHLAAWLLAAGPAGAGGLTLEEYLNQVSGRNAALAAARAGHEAARRSADQGRLLTSPYAFATLSRGEDHSQQLDALIYGDSRAQSIYALGFEKQTDFGLTARLAHQTSLSSVSGASPLFLPMSEFYTSQTSLELREDLWRNAFGSEIRASVGATEAKAQADADERAYQAKQILVRAEIAYWQLVLAREMVRLQEDLLDRARKIEAWTASRVRLKLLDPGDLMQSSSGVEARVLTLASVQDRERSAARAFNVLRGLDSEVVAEQPSRPAEAAVPATELPEKAPVRLDVRAQEQKTVAAARQAAINQEALLPILQASLAASMNGLEQGVSNSLMDSFSSRYYAFAAGVTLNVPLDWGIRSRVRGGYELEAEAAAHAAEQLRLEAEAEWQELRRRLRETSARLEIARRLEDLQKRKADYERTRLRTGNTTTYQVLQFEQDWGQSQLARIAVEGELLELLAQVKLYQ